MQYFTKLKKLVFQEQNMLKQCLSNAIIVLNYLGTTLENYTWLRLILKIGDVETNFMFREHLMIHYVA